jgi:hypothetical protein
MRHALFQVRYSLPSSVSSKSFACHSYENCRGVPQLFPLWNPPLTKSHTVRLAKSIPHDSARRPIHCPTIPNLLSPFFSDHCALCCTFLHLQGSQPLYFQAVPHCASKKRSVRASHFGLAPNSQRDRPQRITKHGSRAKSHEASHPPAPILSGLRIGSYFSPGCRLLARMLRFGVP